MQIYSLRFAQVVVLVFMTIALAISSANAQQPAVAQDKSGTSGATEQSTASPSPAGKAVVYVYRQAHIVGAAGHPLIFVNGNFLAVLKNSNVAQAEVPQGTAVFSATVAELQTKSNRAYRSNFPPALQWPKCVGDPKKLNCTWDVAVQSPEPKEDHGCAKLDWRSLDKARPEDVATCEHELLMAGYALDQQLGNQWTKDIVFTQSKNHPVAIIDSPNGPVGRDLRSWLQMCGSSYSGDWPRCSDAVQAAYAIIHLKERLQVEVEAGKSYYVKWSVTSRGGKMQLMDEAKGAKEMHKLHPVKD